MEKLTAKIERKAMVGTVVECLGRIEFQWVADGAPFEVVVSSTEERRPLLRQVGEPGFDDLWSHAARAVGGDNAAAQKLLGMMGVQT